MSTDDVDLPSLANVLAERLAEARARLSEVEAERDAAVERRDRLLAVVEGGHAAIARKILDDLERHTSGRLTYDQALVAAQVHATLAVAAALEERRTDG